MRTLCRIAEYLKLQRLVWGLILLFAAIGFLISLLAFFSRLFKDQDIPILTTALKWFSDLLPLNPEAEGVLRTVSLTFIPLAITFGFVVCRQRQAVIDALVEGYWKNYLSHMLNGTNFDMVIVRATYGLSKNPELLIGQIKLRFQEELGITLRDEPIVGTQRTGHRAYRDERPLNVVFDFSRNLIPLGAIVDSELGKPLGGTFCRPEYKFDFIAERIYKKLTDDWLSLFDFNSRVMIVSHHDWQRIKSILDSKPNEPPTRAG